MYTIYDTIASQTIKDLQVHKVFRTDAFELLSITLEKGSVFPEHTSPREAALLVLEGSILFHIEGVPYRISRQRMFHFRAKTPHWVEALEDAKFLIIR